MADEDIDAAEHFIEAAAEVTGGMAGAALGFIVAGPPGALGGGAAGPLVTRSVRWVARELRERFLGPREEVRIGTALTYAVEDVRKRSEAGQQVRADGFFDQVDGARSHAEEVTEGVLLAAQRSYEERKVPYHGRLLAGIAFDATISRSEANHLLRVLDEISYQQFVLLQIFGLRLLSRVDDWRGDAANVSVELVPVLADALDLYNRGLINNGGDVMFGLTDLKPADAKLQGMGFRLLSACGVTTLEDVDEADRLLHILDVPRTTPPAVAG